MADAPPPPSTSSASPAAPAHPADTPLAVLKAKDFASDQDVRWCPGCGDYAILNQVRKVCAKLGSRRENTVFISGIGCSSRFPYYMNTYGFHSIHGRAPGFASGVKIANPELDVWMVTGDGDGLSIGGNHMMHVLRRNFNINLMLFNNRIYGLTKGQYSPTSEVGKKTKSSPMGSLDYPIDPIALALASQASFIARQIDVDRKLPETLERAAEHRGTSFVEIYQDCNIFNHKAFAFATEKDTKEDQLLYLEHGRPMVFGKNRDKGLRLIEAQPQVVALGNGVTEDDLLFHDETDVNRAVLLSQLHHPEFPEPVGVFYREERPCYEDLLVAQIDSATERRGPGSLDDLFNAGDVYQVETDADTPSTHGLHTS